MMNTVHVAIGVIFDSMQRVLITLRPHHVSHGGRWEFPGGKIEVGESPAAALRREMEEEVGLIITAEKLAYQIEFDYPDKQVKLFVFYVTDYEGHASCLASQLDLRWVAISELGQYSFPEANQYIIDKLNRADMLIKADMLTEANM